MKKTNSTRTDLSHETIRVRAEKIMMKSTMWIAGAVAAAMGWVGLEVAVGLWISAHRVTIVALAAVIAVQLVSVFGFLGLARAPVVTSAKSKKALVIAHA